MHPVIVICKMLRVEHHLGLTILFGKKIHVLVWQFEAVCTFEGKIIQSLLLTQ